MIGEEGLPINPLQIFATDTQGPKSVATRVSDVFDAAYHLGDIQRKVVIDAIRSAFDKAGISETDSTTWTKDLPTLLALQNVLEEMAANKEYSNYKNAGGVAARLMTFFMLTSFRSDIEKWSWDSLLTDAKHKVHVLQFRGLEGKTQRGTRGTSPMASLLLSSNLPASIHSDSIACSTRLIICRSVREGRRIIYYVKPANSGSESCSPHSSHRISVRQRSPTVHQSWSSRPQTRRSKFLNCCHRSVLELFVAGGHQGTDFRPPQGRAFFITKNRGHVVALADFKKRATLWHQK